MCSGPCRKNSSEIRAGAQSGSPEREPRAGVQSRSPEAEALVTGFSPPAAPLLLLPSGHCRAACSNLALCNFLGSSLRNPSGFSHKSENTPYPCGNNYNHSPCLPPFFLKSELGLSQLLGSDF